MYLCNPQQILKISSAKLKDIMEYYYCQRKADYFQKAIGNLHYCEKLQ